MEPATGTTRFNDLVGSLGRWLILIAGITALVATLILPAQLDLRSTRVERDHALHTEQARTTQIQRYERFLAELDQPSDETIDLLAMSQLGMIADDRQALLIERTPDDPQIFEYLDLTPVSYEPPRVQSSRLERLTTGARSRFWFVLIGAVAIMYGLLPAAKSSASSHLR